LFLDTPEEAKKEREAEPPGSARERQEEAHRDSQLLSDLKPEAISGDAGESESRSRLAPD
jgi:hypothetical protein